MKVGIITTKIVANGVSKFYNSQDIGLARALSSKVNDVFIYKLISNRDSYREETLENYNNITLSFLPSKSIGTNGVVDLRYMNSDLSYLIYFSDMQFMIPRIYKWCYDNSIKLLPYIGVTESHNHNTVIRLCKNSFSRLIFSYYRKCMCLAKTPKVKAVLESQNILNTVLLPVGLDMNLVKRDFDKYDRYLFREEMHFEKHDKIILFIGRLVKEKKPLEMLDYFHELWIKDESYRLIIIGDGKLLPIVKWKSNALKEKDRITILTRIPNDKIWKFFHMADIYVNLSRIEIFGMAILEAMFYKCKVIAWKAPGPNYIIQEKTGKIADSKKQMLKHIEAFEEISGDMAHEHINKNFTWEASVKKLMSEVFI